MTARPVIDRDGARKADLAAIHIAKAELRWDDDLYRDVLYSVCRVRSSALLDFTGRKRFLAHLRACGWKGGAKAHAGASKPVTARVRAPLTARQKKMWSLWQQLADASLVENRKMVGLLAFVKRQTGVDRLEWLNLPQEQLVVESLKQWVHRKGEFKDGAVGR